MDEKPYFITTPIYYVNDVPHIGHAYTTIAADVLNRFERTFKKRKTLLLVGTDEHGAKIAEAAKKTGKDPKEFVDLLSALFKKEWSDLNIEYDRFIRTTDPDHIKTVEEFLQNLFDKGFITKGIYEGLYCVGCEKFKSPEELVGGRCPDHNLVPEFYKEENYFFSLSRFKDELFSRINEDLIEIRPIERKNEILGKLEQGLHDISISRSHVPWGIPMPFDKTHTIYVWIDALINYYTFGKQSNVWPADIHIVGKDILWFHAVIWPAMLLAIGVEPPKKVFAHGFFTIGGSKMSKTLGNVITPQELIEKFGVDGTRYLLLSSFPFGTDGDFDWARLIEKYNADLANGVGNLASRITTLAAGMENIVFGADSEIQNEVKPIFNRWQSAMESLDFYGGAASAQELVKMADKYLNDKKPWALEGAEKNAVLINCLGMLGTVAGFIQPFMPGTAKKIFDSLGLKMGEDSWGKATLVIKKGESLFPRIGS